MNIYFFSRHEAHPEMVQDLNSELTAQFRGTVEGVRRVGDAIAFVETTGETKTTHTIPADSIVIAVAPLPLQEAWLRAGVSVLLLPQNRREVSPDGTVKFVYSGLLRVKKIVVETEQWAGVAPLAEQTAAERNALSAAKS